MKCLSIPVRSFRFRLLFLNLGITSLLFQTLLLRELVVSFYGNEFFVGIVLALWLFWTAVGSFVLVKIKKDPRRSLVILHLFISLFIISSILFIRFFRIPGTTGGEIPNFFASLLFVALILAPAGLGLGSIFAFGVKVWSPFAKATGDGSTAYFWEVLGFLAAGLVFNFFLVTVPALPVAFLLAGLNLGLVFLLLPKGIKGLNLLAALLVLMLGVFWGRKLETVSQRWRFPDLVQAENSRYGQIAVTKTGEQYNFYESGLLVGADKDLYAAEFLVHPVLIQHPNPNHILLVGGGWNGVLAEILKYPSVEKVDYVELDPRFLQVVEKYLSEDLKKAFNDPRVAKHFVDGRRFLKHTSETYDVVIFNLPNPSTALLNRFYTRECFAEVKRILDPKGLVALGLSTPTDYLSAETENLLASVYKTLREVFGQTEVLAEEGVLFLAGKDLKGIKGINGLKDLKVETKFLTAEELEYRLESDKNLRIQKILEENQTAKINSDFYPASYFYQTLFWQTKFSFVSPKILSALQQPVVWGLLGILLAATVLFVGFARPGLANAATVAVLTVGLGGLTLMATEVILIFLFQTILGFVFSRIALLMALVLGGLAVGNFWGRRFRRDRGSRRELLTIQILIACYLLLFLKVIPRLNSEIEFYLLGMGVGILVGTIFPLVSKTVKNAGLLYAADLAGSFLGALLPSLFLIPLFGVANTIAALALSNLIGIVVAVLWGGIFFYDRMKKL